MHFITNRSFKEGPVTQIGRKITFNLDDNAPSNSIYFCYRNTKEDYTELGSAEFLKAIRKLPYKQILLYIHGYSNLPEDSIFQNSKKLQDLLNLEDENTVLILPVIWPCDNDFGIVKDYWDDQKSADASGFSLARGLNKFLKLNTFDNRDFCYKSINVLAHSMGNRVLRETLRIWDKYDLRKGVPQIFKNIFMVASDIRNTSLEKERPGELISLSSKNTIVYFASDDLALRASKVANLKNAVTSARLGHTGPDDLGRVSKNVYTVDCSSINTVYDHPVGHSYFLGDESGTKRGKVLEHIYNVIQTSRFSNNLLEREVLI